MSKRKGDPLDDLATGSKRTKLNNEPSNSPTTSKSSDPTGTNADLIAQKRAEVAQKLAAMKKTAPPTPSHRPDATPRPGASYDPVELARRVQEAKVKVRQQMVAAQHVALAHTPDDGGRGLQVEVHPMLEMLHKTDKIDRKAIKQLIPKTDLASSKVNQRYLEEKKERWKKPGQAAHKQESKNPYLAIQNVNGVKQRKSRKLNFAPQGKYIKQAENLRREAQLDALKKQIEEKVKTTGLEQELELVADAAIRREDPPAVEWWDAPLLTSGSYDDLDIANGLNLDPEKGSIVSPLVQHPVAIPPPVDTDQVQARPVMLTKQERKKLRRQTREEKFREKQDKIRLGLLPPDPPRVKIGNLMRVLGSEAVQDPTKIEAEVRKQMEARQRVHLEHNAEKKLTPEERRAKKIRKLVGSSPFTHVAVFRLNNLTDPQQKFKVDKNAQQLQLSGACMISPDMAVVIVEGTPKAIKRYKKLMMRRIDWSGTRGQADDDYSSDESDNDKDVNVGESSGAGKANECVLVWEGEIKARQFEGFRFRLVPTDARAKDFLAKNKTDHYWDIVKRWNSKVTSVL